MTKQTEIISEAEGRLVFTRHLNRPIETVWAFLVEDEKRGQWLCRGLVEPEAGGRVEFKFDPEDFGDPRPEGTSPTAYTADFEGQVVTYDAPNVLAFTWPSAKGFEDTLITMKLVASGNGTDLTLTHERIGRRSDMIGSAAGWHTHLELLDARLSGHKGPHFFERHHALEQYYKDQIDPAQD